MARSGYPVRLIHQEFYARYRLLAVGGGGGGGGGGSSTHPPSPIKGGRGKGGGGLPHVIDNVKDPVKAREWCLKVLDAILEEQVGGWVG